MYERKSVSAAITGLWVLALCPVTWAQPVDAAASMRSRVAAIAKLTIRTPSPEGLELVRKGLGDPDPSVRAAAARVAHVMGLADAVSDLRVALPAETDLEATREMAWALAGLDATDGSDEVLAGVATASRFPEEVVSGIVAGRGPRVAAMWPRLKDALEENPSAVSRGLTRGLHESAGVMFTSFAIRDGLPNLATALLLSSSSEAGSTVAVAAAGSSNSRVRAAAFFVLASHQAKTPEGFPELTAPETLLERVARHLFEASTGGMKRENLSTLVKELSVHVETQREFGTFFRSARDAARGLTASDREKLLKAAGLHAREVDRAVQAKYDQQDHPKTRPTMDETSSVLRTFSGHPLEFARSVVEASNCRGRERFFDGVEAVYGPGGRPKRVEILRSGASVPDCAEAAHILGASAMASEGLARVLAILPERPEFLACVVESSTRPPVAPLDPADPPSTADDKVRAKRIGGNIKEPTKIRNIAPQYPTNAKERGAQGIVLVEAEIAPSGCVAGMRILRGVDPVLNLEALDAVSGWKYTPTLLNGIPVPVIMTVTVNFRLR